MGLHAHTLRSGMLVRYFPGRSGRGFVGLVDGEPWQLGGGQWVVRLREMERDYIDYTQRDRNSVPAASLDALELPGLED